MIRRNRRQPEPDHDPVTGEVYTDPDERELWSLTAIPAEERRKLIHYIRSIRSNPPDQPA